jgi:trehalose 6-phosphate phosphatase
VDALATFAAEPARAALFLDVDGVLAPIVARPEDAAVPAGTRAELERLASSYGLVACVTGRDSAFARKIVGVDTVRYVGQHGLELEPAATAWAERIHSFARQAGWDDLELKPLTAAFHYRTAPDQDAARVTLEEVATAALAEGFRTKWGRMVLEIVPPVDASKGTAVHALLDEAGLRRALYAGDDVTDLDGFRALDGLEVAVRVAIVSAEGPSELGELADVVVGSTDAFVELLRRLCSETQALADFARLAPRDVELRLLGVAELKADPVGRRAPHADDLREVHEVRAVDAREADAEPVLQVTERRGAEIGAVVGVHAAVVAVGLHVVDLVVVEQLGPAAHDDRHLLDGRRVLQRALVQPLDNPCKPIRVDRLQEVVERLDRERVDRVLGVRGHEDDCRRVALFVDVRRRLEPGDAGHLHVEEHDVVVEIAGQLERLGSARRLADNLHLRMRGEQVAELRPRRRLVVDEERSNHGFRLM